MPSVAISTSCYNSFNIILTVTIPDDIIIMALFAIKINSGCFVIHAIIIFTLSSFKNAKFRYVKTAIGNTIAIRISRSFLAQHFISGLV